MRPSKCLMLDFKSSETMLMVVFVARAHGSDIRQSGNLFFSRVPILLNEWRRLDAARRSNAAWAGGTHSTNGMGSANSRSTSASMGSVLLRDIIALAKFDTALGFATITLKLQPCR